ncbi:hypothetical protein [Stenotrophomonas sp.]|uniref:hypothetical protein n=1 Tax=Stenotrophomonas sp. TaxID=69392 RepID=UPI002FCBAD17
MATLINLDKKYSRFLFTAMAAVSDSEWVRIGFIDLAACHVRFEDVIHERDGQSYYTLSFCRGEVTQENWMSVSMADVGGVHVDVDIRTGAVIGLHADR